MKHTTITHAICISLLVLSFASLTPGLHAQSPATNTVIATNLSVTNLATPQASTNTVLPLTVQECVAMALDKNRDYLMAKQDVKIKEAAADALYANFFPSLAFKSTLTVLDPAMVDDSKTTLPPTLGGGTMQTVYSPLFTMGLSATYAIPWIPFFSDGAWGMINKGHELLLKDLEQARNKLGKIQQDVTASVSKAFWQLKLAELVYDLTSSNNGRLVAYLDVARRNFNEGRVSKYELLRAQVQLANNQPELLRAENNVRLARVALLQQLSLDLGTRVEIRGRMETAFVTVNEQQALASAMTNRSELKDTDLALEVARLQRIWPSTAPARSWPPLPITTGNSRRRAASSARTTGHSRVPGMPDSSSRFRSLSSSTRSPSPGTTRRSMSIRSKRPNCCAAMSSP